MTSGRLCRQVEQKQAAPLTPQPSPWTLEGAASSRTAGVQSEVARPSPGGSRPAVSGALAEPSCCPEGWPLVPQGSFWVTFSSFQTEVSGSAGSSALLGQPSPAEALQTPTWASVLLLPQAS